MQKGGSMTALSVLQHFCEEIDALHTVNTFFPDLFRRGSRNVGNAYLHARPFGCPFGLSVLRIQKALIENFHPKDDGFADDIIRLPANFQHATCTNYVIGCILHESNLTIYGYYYYLIMIMEVSTYLDNRLKDCYNFCI